MALRFTRIMLLAPVLAGAGLIVPRLAAQSINLQPAVQTTPPPAATPAPTAASSQPKIYLSGDGTTIYLVGPIMGDSFKRFDAVLTGAPKARTLFLASPGGLTLQARLIAAQVRKRKLNTYVEQYCASSCTQLFVAGRERVIGHEAVLGFHQAIGVDRHGRATQVNRATDRALTPTSVFGVNGTDTLRLAYEIAGLDNGFIEKVLSKNHQQMWLPSVKELHDARVITRQAEKPEFPLPEGSITKDDLRALLAKRLLWERASRLYPAVYESSFDSTWRLANSGSSLELSIGSGRSGLALAISTRLSQASESIIDRHLTLYAIEARNQVANHFQACTENLDDIPTERSETAIQFEQAEDQLLVEALDNPPAVELMPYKEALKIFRKDILPLMPTTFQATSSCQAGFQIVLAINGLTGKKRIKTYRAMLFLNDALRL